MCALTYIQEWAQAANIRLLTSTEVTDIITQTKRDQQPEQLPPVCVKAVKRNGGQEEVIEMRPRLLIAADGECAFLPVMCVLLCASLVGFK